MDKKTIIPPFLGQSLSPTQDGAYTSLCFLPGVKVHPYKASFPLWESPEHPLPAPAPTPECLGTVCLCGSRDDQVWECCSITFTTCVPAAGPVLAAKPKAGSGWPSSSWDPHAPHPSPSLTTLGEIAPRELEINSNRHSCCTNSRFQAIFLEGEQKQRFLTCVWRKGLETLAAAKLKPLNFDKIAWISFWF